MNGTGMRAGRTPRRRARVRHDAIGRLLVMAMVAALLVTSPTGPATPAAADGNEAPNAPAPFRGMTAGGSHTCVLLTTGSVKCWGDNAFGQLGLGDTIDRGDGAGEMGANLPTVNLGTGRTATALSAGAHHTCALLDNGTVKCWGNNSYGRLGVGDTAHRGDAAGEMGDSLAAVPLGVGRTATAISAGYYHTCALLDNASVKCWGRNADGQLGLGDTADRGDGPGEMGGSLPPVSLGTGRTATAIVAGGYHSCARLNNATVKCWGENVSGQLGLGDTVQRGDNTGEMGDSLPSVSLGTGRTVSSVTAGYGFTCALLDNGSVKCWGANHYGQLGLGDTTSRGNNAGEMGDSLPTVSIGSGHVALAVTSGMFHACVKLEISTVRCWGRNTSGRLGLGDVAHRGDDASEMGDNLPEVPLGAGRIASAVTAGGEHTCTRLDNGSVKCWGEGGSGQLGQASTADIGDGSDEMGDNLPAIDIGVAPSASLAVVQTADEATVTEGATVHLHLEIANTGNVALHNVAVTDADAPTCQRPPFTLAAGATQTVDCTHVATIGDVPTYTNTASVDTDETDPVASNQVSVTVTAATPGTVLQVASGGGEHTCALLAGGAVKCWGANGYGQLGLGDTQRRGDGPDEMGDNLPAVNLGTGRTATTITAGGDHTCALLDNGATKCWGYNFYGQLGLGDTQRRGDAPGEMGDNLPAVNLGTGRTATTITAGGNTTCAVLDNGATKCWGYNSSGQLGLGDTNQRGDAPGEMGDDLPAVNLGTGRTATTITAGGNITCAVLDNGAAKCWGYNFYGQLGLGDMNHRGDGPGEMGDNLPAVNLGTGRTATTITAGGIHTCAVLDNSATKCWGYNGYAQLGLGDTVQRGDGPGEMGDNLPAVDLGTGRTATTITAGGIHTCAVLDNSVTKCWGFNDLGQLGLGDTVQRGDGPGEMGDNLPAVNLGTGRTATTITASGLHTCAVLDNSATKCWGYNVSGQLGLGDTANRGDAPGEMGDNLPVVELTGSSAAPAMTVAASADESTVVVGETIHLHVTVANTGNVALNNVTIADANAPGCSAGPFTLAVGANHTVDCTHVAVGGDVPTFTNTATADSDETSAVDSNQAQVTVVAANPAFTVVKSADEASVSPGQAIHYHLVVANTGNVALHGVDVTDAAAPDCGDDAPFDLAVGASQVVNCERVAGGDDVGTYPNTASVDTAETGPQSSNQVDVTVLPAISVAKTATETSVVAGEAIHYQVQVTNTSAVSQSGITVSDPNAPTCDGAVPTLAPGADHTVNCTYTTRLTDVGTYTNTATADSPTIAAAASDPVDVTVEGPPYHTIAAGDEHTCALRQGGTVKCWGANNMGQLGQGNTTQRGDGAGEMGDDLAVTDLGGGRTARAIAAGDNHTCVVLDNHTVKCWGRNDQGQLGLGDTANRGDAANEMGDDLPAVNLGTGRTAVAVTVGSRHSCALLDNATVKCWGFNTQGQLGLGDTANRGDNAGETGDALPAVDLGAGRTATSINAGGNRTCAFLDNGTVKCWGNNDTGQLGLGDTANRGDGPGEMGDALSAVNLGTGRTVVAMGGGTGVTCVILDDATLKCWGSNQFGQLGLGDNDRRGDNPGEMGDALPAVSLGTGRSPVEVATSGESTCAILDDATTKCWGRNHAGQLGLGDTVQRGDGAGEMGDSLAAVSLGTGRSAVHLSAHGATTCALLDNDDYKCWGQGGSGQLGQGNLQILGNQPGEMGNALDPIDLGALPLLPGFTVVQSRDENHVMAGETIHLHFVITNTGNVELTNVTITDDLAPECEVAPFTIAVGASTTVHCDRPTTEADVPTFTNTATVDTDQTGPTTTNQVSAAVESSPALIRGTVTDAVSGDPIPGAWAVMLNAADFTMVAGDTATATGEWVVAVPAGSYFVYLIDPGANHHPGFGTPANLISVSNSDETYADRALEPSRGSVTGTITETGTGTPLSGAWALALNYTGITRTGATTNGNGEFALGPLTPGDHYIAYIDPAGGHPSRFYPNSPNVPDATRVPVTAGPAVTANGSLPVQTATGTGAALTGTVTETGTGTPIPDAFVVALRAADYAMVRGARTDSAGHFTLNVTPGAYKVVFLDSTGLHDHEWHDNHPVTNLGDADSVTAPGTANASLAPNTGTLAGTITDDPDGHPLGAIWIIAIGPNGIVAAATTGPDGTFTIPGLPPDTYRAGILDPIGGHSLEYYEDSPTFPGGTDLTITAGDTTTIETSVNIP